MTDDLIARLRAVAIRPDIGELGLFEAADALEAQARRIAELESMIAVHRLAVDVDALKARIAELKAALNRLHEAARDINENEMTFTERDWWLDELRAARAAYRGEKG